MFPVKAVYYSLALCLFVWGCGWLIYDYTGVYAIFDAVTFQNILFVVLGVTLSFVAWFGLSPKKSPEQVIQIKGCNHVVSRGELEAKLWETDPGSKERERILKQLNELE